MDCSYDKRLNAEDRRHIHSNTNRFLTASSEGISKCGELPCRIPYLLHAAISRSARSLIEFTHNLTLKALNFSLRWCQFVWAPPKLGTLNLTSEPEASLVNRGITGGRQIAIPSKNILKFSRVHSKTTTRVARRLTGFYPLSTSRRHAAI